MRYFLKRITVHNIDYAVRIQAELFPKYSARVNYRESLDSDADCEYYTILKCDRMWDGFFVLAKLSGRRRRRADQPLSLVISLHIRY